MVYDCGECHGRHQNKSRGCHHSFLPDTEIWEGVFFSVKSSFCESTESPIYRLDPVLEDVILRVDGRWSMGLIQEKAKCPCIFERAVCFCAHAKTCASDSKPLWMSARLL